MGKETDPQERAALEQKVADMVQQSKMLESYLNDILTRRSALSRLIRKLISLQNPHFLGSLTLILLCSWVEFVLIYNWYAREPLEV
jgi:hypothetical protein